MDTYYRLSIPSPCSENWDEMRPVDNGRHCAMCTKTVIDFTNLNAEEIRNVIEENKSKSICGHVKQSQLREIHLKVPVHLLQIRHSGRHAFLLALLMVMGTTLFSCTDSNGYVQKINSVEVVDSTAVNAAVSDKDSYNTTITDGVDDMDLPIMGGIGATPPPEPVPPAMLTGEVVEVQGMMVIDEKHNNTLPLSLVTNSPRFSNTPNNLTKQQQRAAFEEQLNAFIQENINLHAIENIGTQRQRAQVSLTIDADGFINIDAIRVNKPNESFEREIRRVFRTFPKLSPAVIDGQRVAVTYGLPIIINPE